MSEILNFTLPSIATNVNAIICLYDPKPPLQYQQTPYGGYEILTGSQLQRNSGVASAGFPSSPNAAIGQSQVYPLPANAYGIALPSQIFGTPTSGDNFSVITINTGVARVEPGFSRLRIDWVDSNQANQSTYFDCPFYEAFRVTARELNNIIAYVEEAFNLIQLEINNLVQELAYLSEREFWRGTSVSGQLQWTGATEGLVSGPLVSSDFSDALVRKKSLNQPKSTPVFTDRNSNTDVPIATLYAGVSDAGSGGLAKTPTGNCNYAYFDNPGNYKGTALVAENTDGTVSILIWDSNTFSSLSSSNQNSVAVGFTCGDGDQIDAAASNGVELGAVGCIGYEMVSTGGNGYPTRLNYCSGVPFDYVNLTCSTGATVHVARFVCTPTVAPGTQLYLGSCNGEVNGSATSSIGNDTTWYDYTGAENQYFTYQPSDVSIAITPSTSTIIVGSQENLECIGTQSDGSTNDVTQECTWTVVSGSGSFPSPGLFQSPSSVSANGETTIVQATLSSLTATATIFVNPPYTAPTFTVSTAANGCCPTGPNSTITLNGTNLNSSFTVYINDLSHPATNVNYVSSQEITCTIPNGIPPGTCTVILDDGTHPDVTSTFTLLGSPTIFSIVDETTGESGAGGAGETLEINGTGFGSSGVVNFTDSYGDFYQPSSVQWSDTQISFIIPENMTKGTYTLNLQAYCGTVTAPFTCTHDEYIGPPPILVIIPQNVSLYPTQVQNFEAYELKQNETPVDVTNQVQWYVNGIPNGDSTDGTISAAGLYTAPSSIGSDSNFTATISATITYEAVPDDGYDGTALSATSVATINQPTEANSPVAHLSVTSQINVFLGDGRAGYIPTGTTYQANPGDYVYVKFQEKINPTTSIPIASNTDIQTLSFHSMNALNPNISQELYNVTPVGINADGTIQTYRSVVLGIIDPTDGNWHSMWDIGLPPVPVNYSDSLVTHDMKSLMPISADVLPAFSSGNEFSGSVIDYIDNIAGTHQGQITTLKKRLNTLITGNCFFDENKLIFEILDELVVHGVDKQNRYKRLLVFGPQKINIPKNYILFIDSFNELKTNKIGDSLGNNSIVIGLNSDRFYTQWPILPQYLIQEGSL